MSEIDYDTVGYVESSKYRREVLLALRESPQMPSEIAGENNMPHISRAITNMRAEGLTELLVDESTKKGRIYGLTEEGQQIANAVADRQ